jgi:hypothetical protein
MNADWQSFAAPAVVIITLAIFAWRMRRPKKGKSCGGGCSCKRA